MDLPVKLLFFYRYDIEAQSWAEMKTEAEAKEWVSLTFAAVGWNKPFDSFEITEFHDEHPTYISWGANARFCPGDAFGTGVKVVINGVVMFDDSKELS